MTTKTNICNMALTHISAKNTVTNIDTDSGQEAKTCRIFYDDALRFVLSDMDWNFASARVLLSELSEDAPVDWDYVYSYPTNCVKAREIFDASRSTNLVNIPFEVNLNADKTLKAVFTNQYQANLRYTHFVSDPNLFPPGFVMMLSWWLAYLIAFPLTKKKSIKDDAKQGYQEMKMMAAVADIEEALPFDLPESEFIRARD